MKQIIFCITIMLVFGSFTLNAQSEIKVSGVNSNSAIVEQLKQKTQELLNAIAPGKQEVLG